MGAMQADSCNQGKAALTAKQREALDLLVQHKTSKEISRLLGVSPHTVDQRIESSKKKFGVNSRGELARAYLLEQQACQRLTYENSYMSDQGLHGERTASDEPNQSPSVLGPDRTSLQEKGSPLADYQVLPELFSRPAGVMFRIAAILIMATLMIVAIAGGISIFVAMTDILGR